MDFTDHSSLKNEIENHMTPEKARDRPKVPKVPGFYTSDALCPTLRSLGRPVLATRQSESRLESLVVYI